MSPGDPVTDGEARGQVLRVERYPTEVGHPAREYVFVDWGNPMRVELVPNPDALP